MAEAAPPDALQALARFAAEASAAPCLERLSVHVADGVLAMLAGQRTDEGAAFQAFFARTEGRSLAGLSAMAACMRLSEIDDIHRPSGVTASAIALPVALAMHRLSPVAPARFADAVMVGQSLAVELSLALGGAGLMARGLWPSYLVAPFGAAATAGRMLGLSPERMAHALAMALAQTPRSVGRSTGDRPARWLLFANAVRAGCIAALAAADGMDGDVTLLSPAWLQAVGGHAAEPAQGDSGENHSASQHHSLWRPQPVIDSLSIKPHCAAKQTLAAVHALQALLQGGLQASAIESIELRVPTAYAGMIDREPPSASRLASMVSVRWQLALTALAPALLDDVRRASTAQAQALTQFAAKVQVRADAELDKLYPAAWPAHLVVRAAGQRHELRAVDSTGDPALPMDRAQVQAKAWRVWGPSAEAELVSLAFAATSDAGALQAVCAQLSA
jgi:2-methylcitrate dehydratase PrpD